MPNILKKPTSNLPESQTRYELYNLQENPFPVTPFVNKVSPDNRYNGGIYESNIREAELSQIIENFIKEPQSNPNHIRLGYINDNSYVGRGNGKSAFTLNLIKIINEEFCLDISDQANKCFGLHITPEPSGRTKTFYDLVDLIFDEIVSRDIIDYCLASLRLEAILSIDSEADKIDLESDFNNNQETIIQKLNDRAFFSEKKISVSAVTNKIYEKREIAKLPQLFPLTKDKKNFYGFNITNQNDFIKTYQELRKGRERLQFVFNDLVLFFEASGFNGAYIIIDDFERIPDFQSEKLKHEFALEIRTNFFDGISENARVGFFNLLLVLHAGVPRLIEKAWAVSGMERRSPISSETGQYSKHIISFNKLNFNHTKSLLEIYLEQYRINPDQDNAIFPFTEESITLIGEQSDYNASIILEKSYMLLEQAANEKQPIIDPEFVNKILGKKDDSDEYEPNDISTEESEDLFGKSKSKDS